jgi:hypothetical protein
MRMRAGNPAQRALSLVSRRERLLSPSETAARGRGALYHVRCSRCSGCRLLRVHAGITLPNEPSVGLHEVARLRARRSVSRGRV